LKIDVGVTLIWWKATAVSEHNSFRPEMVLFKFGELQIIRQAAKLNTPPIILRIWYMGEELEPYVQKDRYSHSA